MNRYSGYGTADHFPNIYNYQYKFFHPTPIFPTVAAEWPYKLPLSQGKSAVESRHLKNIHDSTVTWEKLPRPYPYDETGSQPGVSAIRKQSIQKMLPWRSSTDSPCKCSFHSGIPKHYGDAHILGTENAAKFKNLVTSSNILAAHASKTHTWHGAKYSPRENYNTKQLCYGADCIHNTVTMVEEEAKKCIDETGKEQLRCSVDTSDEIASRLDDIIKWTQKLQDELKQNIAQFHEISELKSRLELMMKNIVKPLEISKENRHSRNVREGVELVKDAVEEQLLHEADVFQRRHEVLNGEVKKINAQLTRLRAVRLEIELDIAKKVQARETDECAKLLTTLSKDIGPLPEFPKNQFDVHTSPTTWLQHTQNIIQKSQEERNIAQIMSIEVSKEMLAAANDCFGAWYATNTAFKTRISEIAGAKKEIQLHIRKLERDITTLRAHIADVKTAIAAKTPQLQLAQSRMEKRKERPGIELCRDMVMMSLLKEMSALRKAIDVLTTRSNELETTLEHLLKTKSTLERDLKLKNMALFIDNEKCLHLRQTFPISTFQEARTAKQVAAFMNEEQRESTMHLKSNR